MLDKAKSAGFSMDNPDSLSELGELVDEVPTEDLKNMPPENVKKNLKQITKKADELSPSQKKAVVSQVCLFIYFFQPSFHKKI